MGLSNSVLRLLASRKGEATPGKPEQTVEAKKQFQLCTRKAIGRRLQPNAATRMIAKLQRWHLGGSTGTMALRIVAGLQELRRLVPPRVSAAVLRTLWNGWTTAGRFQQKAKCLLGCTCDGGEDKIEHYATCPIVASFSRSFVGTRREAGRSRLGNFVVLGFDSGSVCIETLTRRAVLVAVYRATNTLRSMGQSETVDSRDVLQQFAKEAVRGHRWATAVLDGKTAHGTSREPCTEEDCDRSNTWEAVADEV